MRTSKEVFRCDYFTVEELASGVYAAIATEEGGALSNAGIIDLGGKTVVFDTFLSADAAQELRKFAEQMTGRKISYAVNSHCHFDHTFGNCAFDRETLVLAAQRTYSELKVHEDEIDDMKKDAPQIISSLKEKLQGEIDELSKRMLERDIRYFETVQRDGFRLRLPDMTFDDRQELSGTSRKIVLLELSGHTESDIVMYLPEEKIAFMGDLLFTCTHPWLGAGDPERWISTLHGLQSYDINIFIPGHGHTGSAEDVLLIEEYIRMIENIAVRLQAGEYKLEDLGEEILKEPFKSWKGNKFLPNIKFYRQYLCKDTDS